MAKSLEKNFEPNGNYAPRFSDEEVIEQITAGEIILKKNSFCF